VKEITTNITKAAILKREMKKYLPMKSRISTKALNKMNNTLNQVFDSIMQELTEYAELSEFTVAKECNKYLVQTKAVAEVKRNMTTIKENINEWLDRLEEGTP